MVSELTKKEVAGLLMKLKASGHAAEKSRLARQILQIMEIEPGLSAEARHRLSKLSQLNLGQPIEVSK